MWTSVDEFRYSETNSCRRPVMGAVKMAINRSGRNKVVQLQTMYLKGLFVSIMGQHFSRQYQGSILKNEELCSGGIECFPLRTHRCHMHVRGRGVSAGRYVAAVTEKVQLAGSRTRRAAKGARALPRVTQCGGRTAAAIVRRRSSGSHAGIIPGITRKHTRAWLGEEFAHRRGICPRECIGTRATCTESRRQPRGASPTLRPGMKLEQSMRAWGFPAVETGRSLLGLGIRWGAGFTWLVARNKVSCGSLRLKLGTGSMEEEVEGHDESRKDGEPARTSPTIEVYSQELTLVDYHVFGDVVWIIPLGSPEGFDMCHHAAVHVAGLAVNIQKEDATFEIHAEQYLSATKTADNMFPVRWVCPDTKRWEKHKPVPGKGKAVSIEGIFTGVERNEDRTVKHFIVDLEKVTFLGQAPVAPKAEESPTKLVNSGTPARLKFTGFFGSQDMKSGEPSTKKRKTADDLAFEESEDKGEGTSTGTSGRRGRH
ncbi:hypothetical protein B0H13DRAFT_1887135 [Mycena leptocephala]|nr:hypothetical protein B0H13DRAFT_1887135 [Mycena leptocephala]